MRRLQAFVPLLAVLASAALLGAPRALVSPARVLGQTIPLRPTATPQAGAFAAQAQPTPPPVAVQPSRTAAPASTAPLAPSPSAPASPTPAPAPSPPATPATTPAGFRVEHVSAAADALPAAPAGWRLGGSALRITGAAGGSGQPVSVLPTGRDLAAAGGSAGGLALFCIDSIGQGAQWIRPPAQTSDPAGRLTFTPREDGICAVFGRMPLAEPGDYAVAGGRFFRTGSDGGFSVLDGLGGPRAAFWSVYAALGGEAALGRPLSRRFEADGQLVQVFERGVIVTDSRTSATARVGAPAPPIPAGAREPEPAPLPSRPA